MIHIWSNDKLHYALTMWHFFRIKFNADTACWSMHRLSFISRFDFDWIIFFFLNTILIDFDFVYFE